MFSWTRKPKCGTKDQKCYGWKIGIAIPKFFITKQLNDLGKVPFLEIKIKEVIGKSNQMWLETSLWSILITTRISTIEECSLSFIPKLVTDEINEQLMGEFMEWEIQEALDQMAPLKAPGLDGMPPLFYQYFWGIMNREVTYTVLAWLNSGKLPHPINHTFVTLIPKVMNHVLVSGYCPIR